MGPHNLSDDERALIRCFEESAAAVGFDGKFSLAPTERGVLDVAAMVRAQTLLQVCTVLGLKGRTAAELIFNLCGVDVPASIEEAQKQLQELCRR